MSNLVRQTEGQPFQPSAGTWNAFVDLVEATRRGGGLSPSRSLEARRSPIVVPVKNVSGEDRDQFDVLELTTPVITPSDNEAEFHQGIAVNGSSPGSDPTKPFVVLLEPLAVNAIGRGLLAGVVPCRLNVPIENCVYAHPVASECGALLADQWGTARILWKESGTGDGKRALVLLGHREPEVRFELKESLAAGNDDSALAHPLKIVAGVYEPDTDEAREITVDEVGSQWPAGVLIGRGRGTFDEPDDRGSRGIARLDSITGRWKIVWLEPAATLIRCRLDEGIPVGGTARAVPLAWLDGLRVDDGETILVRDSLSEFGSLTIPPGKVGPLALAVYNQDENRHDLVARQEPGPFWGELTFDLHRYDMTVSLKRIAMLGGWDPVQDDDAELTARNPLTASGGKYWFAGRVGDRCLCLWDGVAQTYWIVAIEPNDQDWQDLDVVTRTSLTIDFVNGTFHHHYYTRAIRLPGWFTIGDETEH